ncbi:dihydroorotase [Methanotorris igneus]|uniref:Dihydroorotase n=1 Tax=Methanotorris igneus (strain DSM 5666 / JCM 11834 / Kol 5) TaxID=880724 RepID=F6BB55_METIK|nr:dihydroorotase [Methanotorris igneus]AEF95940.1 dihydroorotase, multifunctional complex type [Methanotorris igneus Kol 5]
MLLKNCRIIKNNKIIEGDILIDEENGRIEKIRKSIPYNGETIDLKNKIVISGVIDAHVHFRYGEEKKEDFISGSEAAINGGVCFAIDMPNNKPPITTKELFYKKYKEGKEKSKINIEFNFGVTENNYLETVEDAKAYKIFMVKSVGDLFISDYSKLKDILNQNKLFCIHAEHKDIIEENLKRCSLNSWTDHCKIRDKKSEVEAIKEIIKNLKIIDKIGKYKPHIHFCHVSTKEGLYLIKKAREELKNVKITVEVTPHHLYLNMDMAEDLKGLGKFNPPLRTKEDNIALIKGIVNKDVDIIATDHAPHIYEEKSNEPKNCPSGIPGIETFVPLVFNLVSKKLISLFDAAKMLSENPAKIFNIDNEIREGNLANLTIVDLDMEGEIRGDNFKSKAKFTPFEGWKVKGLPIYTVVNGSLYDAYGKII